jgi:cell division protease FtsH
VVAETDVRPDGTDDPQRDGAGADRPTGGDGPWPAVAWVVVGLVAIVAVVVLTRVGPGDATRELDYSEFLADVRADRVAQVTIDPGDGHIDGLEVDGDHFTTQGPADTIPEADLRLLDAHDVDRDYASSSSGWGSTFVTVLVPLALIGLVMLLLLRRSPGGASRVPAHGRGPGKVHTTEGSTTTFADVAGYDTVKEEVREVVEFLQDPGRFRAIGARIPKGILLVGPPGTGKTLIAKAVAGEAGVPFTSVTGSDFMEMYVGVGAARVRDLFQTARKRAPAIVFVDEIDSIGRRRGGPVGISHEERDQTLNQLLAEMDGFETTEGIVVMAATNRPDILDPALLRAGRFDRQVVIPLPALEDRRAILAVHAGRMRLAPDVDLEVLARGTPGMSGADLANLVNEAALLAVRRDAEEIHPEDLDAARDRVLMGLKRTSLALDEHEKRLVAHHEAGHAVLASLLEHADPVHKVTILPTGMALGTTQQMPSVERHLHERRQLLDALAVQLGGRAAEILVVGDVSTGAANDLVQATRLARRMVVEWGMSDRLGARAWDGTGGFLGDDGAGRHDYSEATAQVIDEEVERLLAEQDERATAVLAEHRDALVALAATLLAEETVDGTEVARIVAGHPAASRTHLHTVVEA